MVGGLNQVACAGGSDTLGISSPGTPGAIQSQQCASGALGRLSVFFLSSNPQLRPAQVENKKSLQKKVDVYVWDVALETEVLSTPSLPPPQEKKNLSDDLALNRPHKFETVGPWRKGIWKQRVPLHVGT